MSEHTGIIEEAGWRKKKPPKEGQNFCMKVSGWNRTYFINAEEDAGLRDKIGALVGKTVKVTYEESGEFRNVKAVEEVAPLLFTEPSNGDAMTKLDWLEKEYRDECGKCINSFIAIGHFANPIEAIKCYQRLVKRDYGEIPQTVKPAEPVKESQGMTKDRPGKVIEPTPEAKMITWIWIEAGKQGIDEVALNKELDLFAQKSKWVGLNAIKEDHMKALKTEQLAAFYEHIKTLRTK